MKYFLTLIVAAFALLVSATTSYAAPFNADNNPNIVANYDSGIHTIVGEQNDVHTGSDVVKLNGQSGNLNQWFLGTSALEGNHGDHSLWLNVGSSTTCPNDSFILVNAAYPGWGDYLQPGANYCVHTNDFQPSH